MDSQSKSALFLASLRMMSLGLLRRFHYDYIRYRNNHEESFSVDDIFAHFQELERLEFIFLEQLTKQNELESTIFVSALELQTQHIRQEQYELTDSILNASNPDHFSHCIHILDKKKSFWTINLCQHIHEGQTDSWDVEHQIQLTRRARKHFLLSLRETNSN